MKILLLLMVLIISPLRHVENFQFYLRSDQVDIFPDYSNGNFSQKIIIENGKVFSRTRSLNFFDLDLNFRIFKNHDYIGTLDSEIRELLSILPVSSMTLREFLNHVGEFLKKNIRYQDSDLPQDPVSVIVNKKANCIGYSNLFSTLLKAVGVKNKFVRGFYLKKDGGNTWVPVPHRWVEIFLSNGYQYFYDPQYQDFSANYILVKENTHFTRIKKFKVHLIKKSREIINR
jgi:hypothetical protein